ncbi:MAG: flavodoxin family protein [Anaerolineae bacterium]
MKALVLYDSVFGNTEKVAQEIGRVLGPQGEVRTVRVGNARLEQLAGLDLLVVGSPTRAFKPTPAMSRFLKSIPDNGLKGVKVAAFDTRISTADAKSAILSFMVKLFGYAAKPMADTLVHKGGRATVAPEGFYVKESEGPLKEGELARAAAWAKTVLKA